MDQTEGGNDHCRPVLDIVLQPEDVMQHKPDKENVALMLPQTSLTMSRSWSTGNVGDGRYARQISGHFLNPSEESFLLGRREASQNKVSSTSRLPATVTMTEIVANHKKIYTDQDSSWKLPLQRFSSQKRGKNKDDKNLSRRIRSYYKAQDDLIKFFEATQMDEFQFADSAESLKSHQKLVSMLSKLSFFTNLALLIAKSVAVALSSSLSIISSLVDSAVDLLSGVIIWWTSSTMKRRNIYLYPEGRSRLEPVAIVILSVVMSLASFQLVVESVQKTIYFATDPILAVNSSDNSSILCPLDTTKVPTMELATILIAASTIVVKFVLFLLCWCLGRHSSSIQALYHDHRNDVMSNTVAIIFGYLGSREFMEKTGTYEVVYIDAIGAILISTYIVFDWYKTGYAQIKLLTGHTAKPEFLSKITWVCLNHHKHITHIDTVRAFHFGNNFLVEADIVLPENMSLKEAHNIGEALQQKLEKFPFVERAFVHLDYETTHTAEDEHKRV